MLTVSKQGQMYGCNQREILMDNVAIEDILIIKNVVCNLRLPTRGMIWHDIDKQKHNQVSVS